MRVGILSDIHSNDLALEAIVQSPAGQTIDRWVNLGDTIGYYFAPRQVTAILGELNCVSIRGNHEDMLCRARIEPDFLVSLESRYGSGIRVALEELDSQTQDYLCRLPHPLALEIDSRKILLSHGTPLDINHYVYPDDDLSSVDFEGSREYDLILLGHTHYPFVRKLDDGAHLVNPGSVGQPRNRQPGAHWAIYDTTNETILLKCEQYDFSVLQQEICKRHPELPYLSEVLGRR